MNEDEKKHADNVALKGNADFQGPGDKRGCTDVLCAVSVGTLFSSSNLGTDPPLEVGSRSRFEVLGTTVIPYVSRPFGAPCSLFLLTTSL